MLRVTMAVAGSETEHDGEAAWLAEAPRWTSDCLSVGSAGGAGSACGVGQGDEVITVPNTYVATAFAISYCGAVPVFVDVDPQTLNLDPARVEEAITPRTRAIVPVHMYGGAVEMEPLRVTTVIGWVNPLSSVKLIG